MNIYKKIIGTKKKFFLWAFALLFAANIFPIFSFITGEENISISSVFAEDEETDTAGAGNESGNENTSTDENKTAIQRAGDSIKGKSINDYIQGVNQSPIITKVAEWASLIVAIFTPIIAILVKFIGSLMGDQYIFGSNSDSGAYNIAQLLYELWDVVRTIVNYGFLLILLFYAVMNIIPYGTDNYSIDKVLPRMIFAIVVVNMTWFGARVVFDVVDVAARVVFALPQSVTTEEFKKVLEAPCKVLPYPPSLEGKPQEQDEFLKNNEGSTKKLYIHGRCYPADITINHTKAVISKDGKVEESTEEEATAINKDLEDRIAALKKKETSGTERDKKIIQNEIEELEKLKNNIVAKVDYGAISIYWSDFNYERFNEGTIAPLFAFSVMQIQNLPRIAYISSYQIKEEIKQSGAENGGEVTILSAGNTWVSLLINTVAALIIMVILIVLFALMLINLFFRIIILWINIIASPLLALNIALQPTGVSSSGFAPEYLGAGAFLKSAFAPVIMGLPLVVGFIMITVGKQYQLLGLDGGITLQTALVDGVTSVHQLFYYILTIAILWIGGVKALEASSAEFIKGSIINPLVGWFESMGKSIAKAPMYISFVSVADVDGDGDRDKLSVANIFQDIPRGLQNRLRGGADPLRGKLQAAGATANMSFTDNFFNGAGNPIRGSQESIKNILKNTSSYDDQQITNALKAANGDEKRAVENLIKTDAALQPLSGKITNLTDFKKMAWEAQTGKNVQFAEGQTAMTNFTKLLDQRRRETNNTQNINNDNRTAPASAGSGDSDESGAGAGAAGTQVNDRGREANDEIRERDANAQSEPNAGQAQGGQTTGGSTTDGGGNTQQQNNG